MNADQAIVSSREDDSNRTGVEKAGIDISTDKFANFWETFVAASSIKIIMKREKNEETLSQTRRSPCLLQGKDAKKQDALSHEPIRPRQEKRRLPISLSHAVASGARKET